MKKFITIILLSLIFIPNNISASTKEEVTLYLFHGDGCIHCQAEKEFLDEIKDDYDNLNIVMYETWYDDNNLKLSQEVRKQMGITKASVPLTIIGDYYTIGFGEHTKNDIIKQIEYQTLNKTEDIVDKIINNEDVSDKDFNVIDKEGKITLPLIGEINAKEFSLPIIALVLGIIDGFNPCAMWILIFLISMLISTKDRKKMWILGFTFILTSAIVYALIMTAWLNVTGLVSSVVYLRIFVAIIALAAAGFNIYSFIKGLKEKDGCTVVDDKKRIKVITKIKTTINESRLIVAVSGIMLLALIVNLIEVSCSAGLPLIFTSILSFNDLTTMQYALYIFIYILFFLIDDLIVFTIAMITFKVTGLSTKYVKYNHIIGGIIMFIIGILLIFKPEWIMFNF